MSDQMLLFDPDVLKSKLTDAMTPGLVVEFDPDEAEAAGAFADEALDEADAVESQCDVWEVVP